MARLEYISPFFIVTDIQTSIAFYGKQLGFELMYSGPDGDPYYAMVAREGVSIMLKAISPGILPIPNHTRHEWARWDAYIFTEEPEALFKEFQLRGVVFNQPIQPDDDQLIGFEVADADGYVLFFGKPNI